MSEVTLAFLAQHQVHLFRQRTADPVVAAREKKGIRSTRNDRGSGWPRCSARRR
jgi:hypothetical protein